MNESSEYSSKIKEIDHRIRQLYEERMQLTAQFMGKETGEDTFGFSSVPKFEFSNATVIYQGVEGAYSQQALMEFCGEDTTCYPVDTWREAMEAIAAKEADYAVLPIENSSAGIVSENFDLMVEYDNCIIGEQIIKIDHSLLGTKDSTLEDITDVYSHPQALMQCSNFLNEHDWEQHSMKNTAGAAKMVCEWGDRTRAALASRITSKIYGMKVLKHAVQNNKNNYTKFIIVTGKRAFREDANKISICFGIMHESGSLYKTLSHFIYNRLNMNKIESRPIQGKAWEYRFFIDFEGNLTDASVQKALRGLKEDTVDLKILGNY